MSDRQEGVLYGVGTGPGDPELLTRKAARIVAAADVIAYFAKRGNSSHARQIAAELFAEDVTELPLLYPVTTELDRHSPAYRAAISGFFDDSAARIASYLQAGHSVAVLSEGDPLFFGSYMHLHHRLADRFACEVIAGVTAMSGCWSLAGVPICQGHDIVTVLPATLPEAELIDRLANSDAAVIMKLGRHLPKVRRALLASGKLDQATYVERGTMADGHFQAVADKADDHAPYFALILVAGWQARS